jgi:hypothetical protein
MRILKLVFSAGLMMLSLSANAERGGWVSSGGEIFRFDRNPWFVRNTTDVKYCVQLDAATMSADEATVKRALQNAFQFWKGELQISQPKMTAGFAYIGGQNFIEQAACDSSVDLVFKFGYGTLSKEEIEFLKTPETYVGVSVRQNYDFTTLKGTGFVYISSDVGPHAYKNNGQLISEAWKSEKLLQYALMHELGHVFGLPHTGTGLMSEVFLDQLLNQRISSFYLKYPVQPFLSYPKEFEICAFSGSFDVNFFQLKEETACLVFKPNTSTDIAWTVFRKKYSNSEEIEIGTLKTSSMSASQGMSAKPAILVHLPEEQKVFTATEKGFAEFLIGPVFMERNFQGFYSTKDSLKPYPVFIDLKADSITVVGTVSNKVQTVMTYAPPNLLQMLYPIGSAQRKK